MIKIESLQLKYIVYRRKSSESEDKQTLSLSSQKRELEEFADKNNLKIVKDFEETQSAYSHGRPKFAEMAEMIKAGKADAILVYHISRLARNMSDGGLIIDMLKDGIIQEVRTPHEVYAKNSGQEFFLALQFAMSKKSSDDTSEFVRRDIQTKLIKGEYPCFAPKGYINIDKDGKIAGKHFNLEKQNILSSSNRNLKRVEKDPIISPIISKVFEECAHGNDTLDSLRSKAFSWGLTGDRRGKKLTKSSIHRVLTNPFYYGAIRWKNEVIEPDELPVETRHDPIISRELFERVQETLGLRKFPISRKRFYIYSNLIKCGECGSNISGMTAKGNTYYRCCKCVGLSYIREDKLEEQAKLEINRLTIDEDFYRLAMEEANKANSKHIDNREIIKKQQKRELDRCQQRLDNLLRLKISPDNASNELLSDQEFLEQKRETLKDMEVIKEKMGDTDQQNQNWFNRCIDYVEFIRNLNLKFENSSPEIKREIFQFVYYNPTITAKVLVNNEVLPHKFVVEYNNRKRATITSFNPLKSKQKDAFASLNFLVRR